MCNRWYHKLLKLSKSLTKLPEISYSFESFVRLNSEWMAPRSDAPSLTWPCKRHLVHLCKIIKDRFGILNSKLSDFWGFYRPKFYLSPWPSRKTLRMQEKKIYIFLNSCRLFYYCRWSFKRQENELSLITLHYLIYFIQSGYKPQ